ncbi:MAG: hypothetical protein LUE17_03320 [Planctomycetaceae bacterium]|nr:hypothetical protein [Planctomycetaceae bacterium]
MSQYAVPVEVRRAMTSVFRTMAGDRPVWVKQARRHENPFGWWAQRLAYGLSGLLLLLPPERMTNNRVDFEASTLRRLAGLGVPVPEVLHQEADYFVMADCGVSMAHFLDGNPEASMWIDKALIELRGLHALGLAHGGAQIKNFTIQDGRIYLIDFEESVPQARLADFQLRDVFLFMLSLERLGHDPDLPRLCRVYAGDGWRALWTRLRQALEGLRPVRLAECRLFDRFSMRDIRSLSRMVAKAQDHDRSLDSSRTQGAN